MLEEKRKTGQDLPLPNFDNNRLSKTKNIGGLTERNLKKSVKFGDESKKFL